MSDLQRITPQRPLLLVGGGKMGSALLAGWIKNGLSPKAVIVVDPDEATGDRLKAAHPGLIHVPGLDRVKAKPSVVVLAVKPQMMDEVLPPCAAFEGALFMSIAAGKSLGYFEKRLGSDKAVVRAMPNTPAAVAAGMTVCIGNSRCEDSDRNLAAILMEAAGEVDWLEDESLMDAVTGLSGSGPAYLFHFVEALSEAGVAQGLERAMADRLARQTVIGAARLLEDSGDDPGTLRENVTSPGGTTAEALRVLRDSGGLAELMTKAVAAATRRSKELSD
jgi:pyrroline-5-carboxylate reductase